MLTIRREQLATLTRAMHARFDYDAYRHVVRYFPDQCAALGKRGTMHQVRDGLSQARGYEFVSQYDLLRFLNLMFSFGSGFEFQEEFGWAVPYLADTGRAPTIRMDLLMEEACQRLYPDLYPGPDSPEFGPLPRPEEDEAEEDTAGFDGLVWNEPPPDPSYVPQSIQPEIIPIVLPPKPGTVPVEMVQPSDQDEDLPTLSDEEWEMELKDA